MMNVERLIKWKGLFYKWRKWKEEYRNPAEYSTVAFMSNTVKFLDPFVPQCACLGNASECVWLWFNSEAQSISIRLDSNPLLKFMAHLQVSVGLSAGKDIKNWHASFQDLANLKKLHQIPSGMLLHLRRRPLAKSPSSSSLCQASGCTAGRQSDFMQGFLAFPSQKSSGFITNSQFHQQKM